MKKILQLGFLSALNIGLLFLFQWHILTQLGPTIETDALLAGMSLPQLVLSIVSGSLMHVLVPLLAGESEEQLIHDAWTFLFLIAIFFSLFAITLSITAIWWVPILVPGFSEVGVSLTIELTRIQLIGMVFSAINGVQWAAYHARQKFIWAEASLILATSFSLFLLLWLLPHFGVFAAALISVLRIALQTGLLFIGMGKPIIPNKKNIAIKKAWIRIRPLLLGTVYYKTDSLIDTYLLSSASAGSLSLYSLAQQIYGAASQLLNRVMAVPLVPLLSRFHKSGDILSFRNAYNRSLFEVAAVCFLGLLILIFFGRSMLDLLVGYGELSVNRIEELWWIMLWISGVFVGGAMAQITSSAFYARGDTAILVRISMISYTGFIFCKTAAFYFWGILGLSITTSLYYLTNLAVQSYLLKKR